MLSQLSVSFRKRARHVVLAMCYGQDVLSFVLSLPGEQPLRSHVPMLGGFIVPLLPGVHLYTAMSQCRMDSPYPCYLSYILYTAMSHCRLDSSLPWYLANSLTQLYPCYLANSLYIAIPLLPGEQPLRSYNLVTWRQAFTQLCLSAGWIHRTFVTRRTTFTQLCPSQCRMYS